MAQTPFNPDIGPQPGNNFVGASQGYTPNRAIGTLFEGLGDAFGQHVKAKDEETRMGISLEARQGVDSAVSQKPDAPITVPPELQQQFGSLGRLKGAYEQGSLSDLEFNVRVDALAKRMRARFGQGYADVIDNQLSNAKGTSTANQIRQELNQAISAAQRAAGGVEKTKNTFLDRNLKYLSNPDFQATYRALTGTDFKMSNDYDLNAARVAVSMIQTREAQVNAAKSNLELEKAQNQNVTDKAMRLATREGVQMASTLFNRGTNEYFNQFQTTFENATADQKITSEERNALTSAFRQLSTQASLAVDGMLNDPNGVYAGVITTDEQRKNVKDVVLGRLKIYEDALNNGDFGVLSQLEKQNTYATNEGMNKLLTDDGFGDFHRTYAAMMKLGYDRELVNKIFTSTVISGSNQTLQDKVNEAIGNSFKAALLTNEKSVMKLTDESVKAGMADAGVLRNNLTGAIQFVLDPAISKEQAAEGVRSMFEDPENADYLKKYAKNDPMALMTLMASPEMTKKLSGTKVWNQYAGWVYKQFSVAGLKAANTILDTQVSSDVAAVTFDGKQFKLNPTAVLPPQGAAINPIGTVSQVWEMTKLMRANQAVADMNMYLNLVEPIAKQDGASVDQLVQVMFNGQDINTVEKQGSLLTQMKAAVGDWSIQTYSGNDTQKPEDVPNMGNRPRGIRNNNPGNIEEGGFTQSQGSIGTDGRFAKFKTPRDGVRAMRELLRSYNRKGLKSVNEIINRWNPKADNQPDNYIPDVAAALGIGPNDAVDLNDPVMAGKLISAMIKQENGGDFYTPEDLQSFLAD